MTSKSFLDFGKHFPYSVVEIIICDKDNNFLLTKRAIPPFKNKWHFPGGIVEKNVPLKKMAEIVAKREVNLDVEIDHFVGVYDLITSTRHDISHLYLAHFCRGSIKLDFQSTDAKFFKNMPNNMIPFHKKMWIDAKKLQSS